MKSRTLYIVLGIIGIILIILVYLYFNSGITINVKQENATITIDDKQFSVGEKVKLKPGEHKLKVELEDYIPYRKIINISFASSRVENIDLRLLPVPEKISSKKANYPTLSVDEKSLYMLSVTDKTMYVLGDVSSEEITLEKISPDFFTNITDLIWSPDQKLALLKQDKKTSLYDFQRYNLLNQEITPFEDGIENIVWSSDSQNILYYFTPESGEKVLVKASKTNTDKEIVFNFLETKIREPEIDWSPDKKQALIIANKKIYVLDMYDKTLTTLNLPEDVLEARFTPTNEILYITSNGARSCDIKGGNIKEYQFNTNLKRISFYSDTQVVLAEQKSDNSYSFYTYDLTNNQKNEIVYNKKTKLNPINEVITSDQDYVYFESGGYVYRIKVDTLEY